MPSGPPELHEKWKTDANACEFLIAAGYSMTRGFEWHLPDGRTQMTEEEASALTYLQLEWDYGGLLPPAPDKVTEDPIFRIAFSIDEGDDETRPGELTFVETETPDGYSFHLGAWDFEEKENGYAHLVVGIENLPLPKAMIDPLLERRRQLNELGFSRARDAQYTDNELIRAAASYAFCATPFPNAGHPPPEWPWDAEWWKPVNRRTALVKATALLMAEIQRLDDAAVPEVVDAPAPSA